MPNAFILYAELLDTSKHLESQLVEKNGILTVVAYIIHYILKPGGNI